MHVGHSGHDPHVTATYACRELHTDVSIGEPRGPMLTAPRTSCDDMHCSGVERRYSSRMVCGSRQLWWDPHRPDRLNSMNVRSSTRVHQPESLWCPVAVRTLRFVESCEKFPTSTSP